MGSSVRRGYLVNSEYGRGADDGDYEDLLSPVNFMTRRTQFPEAPVPVTVSQEHGHLHTAWPVQTQRAQSLTPWGHFPRQEPDPSLKMNAPLSPGHNGFALYPENCFIFK